MFVLVSLSVLGLSLGASLVPLGRLRSEAASALDGLALGMLPALILARLLPHAFESLGAWSLLLALGGFAIASLPRAHDDGHAELRLGKALIMPALWLHAAADGAALAMSSSGRVGDSAGLLAAAAILHRVPEGLFVASQASRRRALGLGAALLATAPLALATVVGALLGDRIFDVLPDAALDGVLAVGAGAMLRLVAHAHGPGAHESMPPRRVATFIPGSAFAVGLVAVLAIPDPHDVLARAQPRELAVTASLLPLFIESAPAWLVGVCGMSVLRAWVQSHGYVQALLTSRAPQNNATRALRGLIAGVPQPFGPADSLRASERLARDDVPPATLLAFTASAALLGWDAATAGLLWLGPMVTCTRLIGSAIIACGAAVLSARYLRRDELDAPPVLTHSSQVRARWYGAPLRNALQEWLEHNVAWLAFGVLAAAVLEAALAPEWLLRVHAPWDLLLALLLAFPGRICVLGMTPVAAVLLHKGASLGAVLIVLWIGPIVHWHGLVILRRHLGPLATLGYALGAAALALALGGAANWLLSTRSVPGVHPLLAHAHSAGELACAALMAALCLWTLLRIGPRGLVAALSAHPHVLDHVHATSEHEAPLPMASHAHEASLQRHRH